MDKTGLCSRDVGCGVVDTSCGSFYKLGECSNYVEDIQNKVSLFEIKLRHFSENVQCFHLLLGDIYFHVRESFFVSFFCAFSIALARARARTLQRFCAFCFHNLHKNYCSLLLFNGIRGY